MICCVIAYGGLFFKAFLNYLEIFMGIIPRIFPYYSLKLILHAAICLLHPVSSLKYTTRKQAIA